MNERTFPAEAMDRLDSPERRTWLPPDAVIAQLGLRSGMYVADIGAGTGYFALPIAAAIAPEGRVFAVDMQPAMLDRLRSKLDDSAAAQIETSVGDAADTGLPGESVDLVFYGNIWHELDDPAAVLIEADRLLRQGGRIAILDWRADVAGPPGPPAGHRIAAERVVEQLREHGWPVGSIHATQIGQYSYLVIGERLSG